MRAPRLSKAHRLASWILIGLFTFLAGAHVVLTVLFYTGVHDTGVGYVLDWEWPAWIITIIDAAVAWLLWFAYRRGGDDPRMGLVATFLAAIMAFARAFWMVLVPVLLVVVIAGSVSRLASARHVRAST